MLRSKINRDSQQSNKVKVMVGSYVYDYDLLTLKVYDQNDKEYTIEYLFDQILKNQERLETINKNLNKSLEALNSKIDREIQSLIKNYIAEIQIVNVSNSLRIKQLEDETDII